MASPSGTSSGSSLIQNSGSEENLLAIIMDERKRKRMISNRESARRSRMRKQKHLDDLTAQMAQLSQEKHQIMSRINLTTQHYLSVESENSILRAQVDELTHRLESLNEIVGFLGGSNNGINFQGSSGFYDEPVVDGFFNPFNMGCLNQPLLVSPDLLQY